MLNFLPYTHDEILIYFDAINCLEDIQVIADYLNENANDYSQFELAMFKRELRFYVELFGV